MKKAEIIIYQPNDQSTMLEVRIEEETIWLIQAQMAELFKTTNQTRYILQGTNILIHSVGFEN